MKQLQSLWLKPGSQNLNCKGKKKPQFTKGQAKKPFVLREPLVWPKLIDMLPTRMRELHQWYMKYSTEKNIMFATRIKDSHFHRGMDDVWIELENLWDLYHQDALDKSLLSAWCM